MFRIPLPSKPSQPYLGKQRKVPILYTYGMIIHFHLTPLSIIHCYFFCAAGPISLSKAPYETCRLATALIPTLKIAIMMNPTRRPMKRPITHQPLSSPPLLNNSGT
jgi:hypothetical protein